MTTAVERLAVGAYRVATDAPESDGTLAWDATTIVVVEASAADRVGVGWSYSDAGAAHVVHAVLRPCVEGRDALDVGGAWLAMGRAIRNLGRSGIAACALSAVDAALWDLKARVMEAPLADVMGRARREVALYGSGGFTSYAIERLVEQLGAWADGGMAAVKMKVGRDAAADPERVAAARAAIGPRRALFVDANGAWTPHEALAMAERFAASGVSWFEEPVSSDDLAGLALVRARAPAGMAIAAGEYGHDLVYFQRMLAAGAVDVLQADATRCFGPSGFLAVGALCAAHGLALSAHCAPYLHLAACCAVPSFAHQEWFHDHVRIERMFFDGLPPPRDGTLAPDLARPGNGYRFKRRDAAPYAIAGLAW